MFDRGCDAAVAQALCQLAGVAATDEHGRLAAQPLRKAPDQAQCKAGLGVGNARGNRIIGVVREIDDLATRMRQAGRALRQRLQHHLLTGRDAATDEVRAAFIRTHAVDRRCGTCGDQDERLCWATLTGAEHAVPAVGAELRRHAVTVAQHHAARVPCFGAEPRYRQAACRRGGLDAAAHIRRGHRAAQHGPLNRPGLPRRGKALLQVVGAAMQLRVCRAEHSCIVLQRPLERRVAQVDQQRHAVPPSAVRRSETSPTLTARWPADVESTSRPIASTSSIRPLSTTRPSSKMSTASPRATSSSL